MALAGARARAATAAPARPRARVPRARAPARALFGLPPPPNPFGPPPRVSFRASTTNVMGDYADAAGASLETYLNDTDRVVRALFPDSSRLQKLDDGVYRTFLLERDFLLIKVQPVVDLRLEPGVDEVGQGTLSMSCVGWELRGLDAALMPSTFEMDIDGTIRSGAARRAGDRSMCGEVALKVTCDMPEPLRMTPVEVFEAAGQAFLQSILDAMKQQAQSSLLVDFKAYQREQVDVAA